MSDTVLVAIITGLASVTVAMLGVFGAIITRRLGQVRAQVANDHSTNLREELDARHNETRGWFAGIWHRLDAGDRRFGFIDAKLTEITNRLDNVEDTIPPKGTT